MISYLTVENNQIECTDAIHYNTTFLVSGKQELTMDQINNKAIIYAIDENGQVQNINSEAYYTESAISNGSFYKVIEKDNKIYTLGFETLLDNSAITINRYNVCKTPLNTQNSNLNMIQIENPFSESIKVRGLKKSANLELYDVSGKLITKTNQSEIASSTLQKGIYLLKISTNSEVKTYKLIKK